MSGTVAGMEKLTITIHEEIHVRASLDVTFASFAGAVRAGE